MGFCWFLWEGLGGRWGGELGRGGGFGGWG
jgi:hypothetical protein